LHRRSREATVEAGRDALQHIERDEFELEPIVDAVKLTITHAMDCAEPKFITAVSGGWPAILSNLKSLLETGELVLKSMEAVGFPRNNPTKKLF
jgi:hypothetical protein